MKVIVSLLLASMAFFVWPSPVHSDTATLEVEVVPFTPTPTPSATPTPTLTPVSNHGGGGGSVGQALYATAQFDGVTLPGALVLLLKDGVNAGTVTANTSGKFTFTLTGLTAGTYQFGFVAEDTNGARSAPFAFSAVPSIGSTTKVSSIILPPTVFVTNESVAPGSSFALFGWGAPMANLDIFVDGIVVSTVRTGVDGRYTYSLSSTTLTEGSHIIKTRIAGASPSNWSQELSLGIGVAVPKVIAAERADVNGDGKIGLTDFSILAFWYQKTIPVGSKFDLNADGRVTLTDFSILVFYWTGI